MANSKKCCKYCKKFKPVESMKKYPSGMFCDTYCASKWAAIQAEKAKQKALAKAYGPKRGPRKGKTRKESLTDRSTRKRAAKEACHLYIRTRDKDDLCICCDRPLGDDYQAGHFYESGNNPYLRYDEDNIHGQRLHCNYFKSGDSGKYRENLIRKIGLERVLRLDALAKEPIKWEPEDLLRIEKHYKKLNKRFT